MAKRYSAKSKFQVVTELLSGGKTPGQVAKVYGVHPNTVNGWKKAFFEKGPEIFSQDSMVADLLVVLEEIAQKHPEYGVPRIMSELRDEYRIDVITRSWNGCWANGT